jgi:hypothetical protein
MFDAFGYLASVLVFLAFYMREIAWLRAVALCSNVAFIAYAAGLHLMPVLLLHVALLPVNAWRLRQALAGGGSAAPTPSTRARTAHHRADAGSQASRMARAADTSRAMRSRGPYIGVDLPHRIGKFIVVGVEACTRSGRRHALATVRPRLRSRAAPTA